VSFINLTCNFVIPLLNKDEIMIFLYFRGTTQTSPLDAQIPSLDPGAISLFFERLEFTSFNVLFCLSPKQELPEDLIKLKQDLGIPNGLPPCVENARLDFGKVLILHYVPQGISRH